MRDLWTYNLAMCDLSGSASTELETPADDVEQDELDSDDDSRPRQPKRELDGGASLEGESELEAEFDDDTLKRFEDESDSDDLHSLTSKSQKRDTKWRRKRRLRVSHTIVCLVLGLWFIRYPIVLVDLETCVPAWM